MSTPNRGFTISLERLDNGNSTIPDTNILTEAFYNPYRPSKHRYVLPTINTPASPALGSEVVDDLCAHLGAALPSASQKTKYEKLRRIVKNPYALELRLTNWLLRVAQELGVETCGLRKEGLIITLHPLLQERHTTVTLEESDNVSPPDQGTAIASSLTEVWDRVRVPKRQVSKRLPCAPNLEASKSSSYTIQSLGSQAAPAPVVYELACPNSLPQNQVARDHDNGIYQQYGTATSRHSPSDISGWENLEQVLEHPVLVPGLRSNSIEFSQTSLAQAGHDDADSWTKAYHNYTSQAKPRTAEHILSLNHPCDHPDLRIDMMPTPASQPNILILQYKLPPFYAQSAITLDSILCFVNDHSSSKKSPVDRIHMVWEEGWRRFECLEEPGLDEPAREHRRFLVMYWSYQVFLRDLFRILPKSHRQTQSAIKEPGNLGRIDLSGATSTVSSLDVVSYSKATSSAGRNCRELGQVERHSPPVLLIDFEEEEL